MKSSRPEHSGCNHNPNKFNVDLAISEIIVHILTMKTRYYPSVTPTSYPLPPSRDGRSAASRPPGMAPRSGFALIISISLMAFILLLMLSLSTLVQTEARTAAAGTTLNEARTNAILGLAIATGELQKHAGADQRATAPATTVYPSKDVVSGTGDLYEDGTLGFRSFANESRSRSYLTLSKGGTFLNPTERENWADALDAWWNDGANAGNPGSKKNPFWTAIYDTSYRVDRFTDPSSPTNRTRQVYEADPGNTVFGEFNRSQLPRWIVSGNEGIEIDTTPDDDAPVTSYPADYLTPDRPLRDQLRSGEEEDDIISIVRVVESEDQRYSTTEADDSADGLDGRVEVLRQPLDAERNNHYAYWVADESVKANFAVRDPYFNATVNSREYRNRLQVPQRLGWERMEDFDDAFDGSAIDVFDSVFEKVVTPSQFRLIDAALAPDDAREDPLRRNFHSLTSFSSGLFTDPVLGGLKKDLTHYLENRSGGPNNGDFIADRTRYDNNDPRFGAYGASNSGFPKPGAETMSLIELPNMPNNFPTFGQLQDWYENEATGGGSGGIDPSNDTAPVLTYYNLMAGFSRDDRTINMHVAPQFILWNPYDAELDSATYEVEIAYSYTVSDLFVVAPKSGNSPQVKDPSTPWVDDDNDGTHDVLDGTQPGVPTTGTKDSPGPVDSNDPTDGINDLNGNYYYYLTPAGHFSSSPSTSQAFAESKTINTANEDKADNDDASYLEGREFKFNFTPFRNGTLDGNTSALPTNPGTGDPEAARQGDRIVIPKLSAKSEIDHILKFTITASFEAGQAKIFSIRVNDEEWEPGGTIRLRDGIDGSNVNTLYFPVATMNAGVSIPSDVRIFANPTNSGADKNTPYIRLGLEGETDPISETMEFGDVKNAGRLSRWYGKTWADANNSKNNNELQASRPHPKGIEEMRHLSEFGSEFQNNFATQDGLDYSDPVSSNFELSRGFIQPFTHEAGSSESNYRTALAGQDTGYSAYLPVFSRFNLGSASLTSNLLVESRRTGGDPDINHNSDWLFNMNSLPRTIWNQDWDEAQHDGPNGAYTLIATTAEDVESGNPSDYLPLTRLAIRNVKRPDSEILSLGQLQQINLSPFNWMPAFPIGNSEAPPYTDREAIAGINSREVGVDVNDGSSNLGLISKFSNNANNYLLDLSYLLNENLWDRYFLSSLPDGALDLVDPDPLPNSRIRLDTALIAEEGAGTGDVRNFDDASVYLRNFGAFNVNSTSVEAWKALLTSFRDLDLEAQSGGSNPDATVPIARSLDPIADPVEFTFAEADSAADTASTYGADNDRDYSRVLAGFRFLSDPEIEALAERIVDEVRLRGPFYSVADFVNRRLVAPEGSDDPGTPWHGARTDSDGFGKREGGMTDFINPAYDPFPGLAGLNGAIQRAINVSGINGGVNYPSNKTISDDRAYGNVIKSGGGMSGIDKNGGGYNSTYSDANTYLRLEPARRHHLDAEHIAGAPASEAGQLLQGAPGFITQGDILSMIGPALTTRGDTFLIRSYGDVVDPLTGEVTARAYLETVVQRTVKPVNPATSDADGIDEKWIPADSFGRSFEVVSMRWLGEDEI